MRRVLLALFCVTAAFAARGEELSLTTPAGRIYGTLLVPAISAPMPVVVIVSGSGPTDRNGNSALLAGANDSLKMLAEGLAARGIASLRYDKRGVGASSAAFTSEAELTFDQYVDDAVSWLELLRKDPRFSRTAIAGHSEGALIALIAAQRTNVDRVISIAGPGRPTGDVILEQLAAQLSPAQLDISRAIVAALNAGKTYAPVPAELYSIFRPSVQPYLISLFRYDPAHEIANVTAPTLIAQGTTDIQVSVADANRLATARPTAALLIVNGMNHVLKNVSSDSAAQLASYSDPTLPINAQLVAAIANLIRTPARVRTVR
ncbi:MAG: alpha/beta hydrolase [Acidobacteria bacterium]|nr:alpha/beta hydrolase [Acidobacteriota bacterium]